MSDDVPTGHLAVRWRPDAEPAGDTALARVAFAPGAGLFDCPLHWLAGDFTGESWQTNAAVKTGEAHGWRYTHHPRLAFAACHVDDGETAADPGAIQRAARAVYARLFALQRDLGLPHAQRIWHWLSTPTAGADDDQRYQRFCRGRAEALDSPGQPLEPLPPATLVASHRRGLRLHAMLGDTPVTPIENPRQVSAYHYPRDYGIRAPAFARAGIARLLDDRYLLISGTASIVGHTTRHPGDVGAQADEALANVAAVIEAAAPEIGTARAPTDLQCIKAYVCRAQDAPAVAALLAKHLPGVPCALLHAPLCRPDLLVEFEAQMRL